MELLPFGIHVTLIEPGPIRTEFARTALAQSNDFLTKAASPYHALYEHYLQAAPALRRNEPGPEVVSRAIQQAIETAHPRARHLVATPGAVRLMLHAGAPIREAILKRFFKISATV